MHKLSRTWTGTQHLVKVNAGSVSLEGNLSIPQKATGIVLFVHGSGSTRHSPRNQFVAGVLNTAGMATLLFDLLTPEEEQVDIRTAEWRFNIDLLADRVVHATNWLLGNVETAKLKIGYFGASTGAAAALVAAAELPEYVKAVVSRGGRPDLADASLPLVVAPTLLIVGGRDVPVIAMNRDAMRLMPATTEKRLEIVPYATHLFEEPGALARVADLASIWFNSHF